ncbi:MAG: Mur ligase family protein [Candidatus Poseidoniales archaeon]|nr:Mur ligase family protein [Candidatus Poseidoniales archaeon]
MVAPVGDCFLDIREWLEERKLVGIKLGLENCGIILERLGNPHLEFPSIHVAGTNGKGSRCVQLSAIATANNLTVGLFTSPHLITIEERIRINGIPIEPDEFNKYLNKIREVCSFFPVCNPTFFEVTFLLAMLAFRENNIDRAIIETGLGGRLDSTRLVDADLCVITTISKDHTEFLGDTLEEIAFEKAGIHRPGVPLLISKSQNLKPSVLKVVSDKVGEDLWIHETNSKLSPWDTWINLSKKISELYQWDIPMLECNWPGRSPNYGSLWFDSPTKICAAHNKEGFEAELNLINNPCVIVIGITEKANVKDALSPLMKDFYHDSIFHQIIFTEPLSGRNKAVSAKMLEEIVYANRTTSGLIVENPIDAIKEASLIAKKEDIDIIILGSVYLVGDILNYIIIRDNLSLWEELRVH